jgi:hypothetical protein
MIPCSAGGSLFTFGRGEPVYEFSPLVPSTASELGGIFYVERERQRRLFNDYHRIIKSIGIRILDDYVQVAFDKGIESFLENWEIGYGPVN